MAMKPFNSVGGLSVGSDSRVVLEADGSANLANVTVNGSFQLASGDLQLGDVGNVHIGGGSDGQYLATDGSGNLSWVTLDTDTLANGSSNVNIHGSGGDVTVSVDGEANVAVFSYDGLTVAGSVSASSFSGEASGLSSITGANVLGDVGGANHANVADVANSVAGSNVSGTVGSASVAYSVDAANVSGTVGSASVAYSVDAANVSGTVGSASVAYSVDAANVSGTVGSASVAYSVDGANVSGQVNSASSADVAYSVDAANVSGTVGSASVAYSIDGANVSGDVSGANHANVADIAYSVDAANVSGTVGSASVAYSVDGANVSGNVAGASTAYALSAAVANVSITGGSAGLVLTTDGSGSLSWTNSNIKYSREIHVDSTLGNDTTGDGSYNKPYATIMKAHSVVTSGFTVFLHVGGYSETVNWTKTNCDIIGLSAGGMVNVTGPWTVGTTTPASVRIKDIAFNSSFTQNSTGRVIFQSCYLRGTFTKTSGEYTQFDDTDAAGTGIAINSAGTVVFNGGSQNLITVNHSSAVVSVLNSMAVASVTATAGTVLLSDSFVYATANTGNAVTSSAGTAVYMYNSSLIAPNQSLARASLGGFWTANDTKYDKANSSLTGTNLGTISYFDAISTQGQTSAGSLQVRGTSTLGAIGNVSISGGTSGQYLQTNGSGNLSWSTVSLSNINNGTSNVSVAASGNVVIASNGQANIATFASNGTFATTTINDDVIVTGNLTVQGNTVSVNVAELNVEDPIITEGRAPNNASLTAADGKDRGLFSYYYDGAEKGAFIGIMTTGAHAGEYVVSTDAVLSNNVVTTSSYGNIVVGNVIGNLANGSTAVGIAGADADITMSVDGTANVVVVDAEGITVNGKVTVGGTGIGGSTLTTTDTNTVALASIQDAAGLAVEFLVKGSDATGTKFEVATLLLVSDGAGSVDYTVYGATSVGGSTGILSATKNGALVELNVTPASSNSTVWTTQYRSI